MVKLISFTQSTKSESPVLINPEAVVAMYEALLALIIVMWRKRQEYGVRLALDVTSSQVNCDLEKRSMWKSILVCAALTSFAAAPASAEQCRDTKGKFIKCEPVKKKAAQCKDAKGKFAKCGTTGAMPVN
ncbi:MULTISPECIES: hypothetical protein [Rhizobium/Agrobacterium group]|uniref:hypothetical protein n=1 Tax=Rhizobium/Agrobacterium group TaxID=227290 RepID=UPI000AE2D29A|nr:MULTISPECIES: hypothetical protein [Rhizobium/Agrobacterium group]